MPRLFETPTKPEERISRGARKRPRPSAWTVVEETRAHVNDDDEDISGSTFLSAPTSNFTQLSSSLFGPPNTPPPSRQKANLFPAFVQTPPRQQTNAGSNIRSDTSKNNQPTTVNHLSARKKIVPKNLPQKSLLPLQGIVACLTGFSIEEKSKYHALIEKLGGRFTRELSSDSNTHLISPVLPDKNEASNAVSFNPNASKRQETLGPKLKLAFSTSHMHIVTPQWLDDCENQSKRLDEIAYIVPLQAILPGERSAPWTVTSTLNQQLKEGCRLLTKSTRLSNNPTATQQFVQTRKGLFSCCQFALFGFDDELNMESNGGGVAPTKSPKVTATIKDNMARLIRRGLGAIFWDHNCPSLTHLIVHDACSKEYRKIAKNISNQHPNQPPIISARWILDCWKRNELLDTDNYPPVSIRLPTKRKDLKQAPSKAVVKEEIRQSTLFRGCMFHIVRMGPSSTQSSLAASSNDTLKQDSAQDKAIDKSNFLKTTEDETDFLDWSVDEQERLIKLNGGRILSFTIIDALKVDAEKQQKAAAAASRKADEGEPKPKTANKRPLYVLFWGSSGISASQRRQYETVHPHIAPMMKSSLVQVTWTTPLWFQTCLKVQKRIIPNRIPILWAPQAWSLRPIEWRASKSSRDRHDSTSGGENTATTKQPSLTSNPKQKVKDAPALRLCVALSGFTGTERATVLVVLEDVWKIPVTHDMTPNNTHLICKQAGSPKYTKAKEWGIAVVSMKWVFHVLQFGFYGKNNDSSGCESDFSI